MVPLHERKTMSVHSRMQAWLLYGLCASAAVALCLWLSAPAAIAQDGTARLKADSRNKVTPRAPDGHVDLSGFYNIDVYHGDPIEDAGGHVVNRSPDGSLLFDYGGANAQGNGVNAGKNDGEP